MKIGFAKKDKTKNAHLNINLSEVDDRIYIDDEVWVATTYGKIKVGVVNGEEYELSGEELVKVKSGKVGIVGRNDTG